MASPRRVRLPDGVPLTRYWTTRASDEEWLLKAYPHEAYPLPNMKLVVENHGCATAVVESGGRYYLWNMLCDDVVRVDEPTDLAELLRRLCRGDDDQWDLLLTVLEAMPEPPEQRVELDDGTKELMKKHQGLYC
jgi:hypothetical protein